ncbi:aldehyde dehydrogenase family protein [Oscillochloris sp. ZM17-4]|uniref:aldehyde dehydrogenase family protein n=1 Tax=Oscillochloris sp. ZM17-4 TaxID=2866714 RepID=UPI001C735152|nr:aldehyde dehydrogenase family protein [Oscillochloris sp. ZM17-4]MBX0326563.1 aldehyde dehydrogenase family protein [Oscillochloris sp. ZM17-4]
MSTLITLDTTALDRDLRALQQQKQIWELLPVGQKIDLLLQTRHLMGVHAEEWVRRSAEAKGLAPNSPWVGEEWVTGPWAIAEVINGYIETLHALEKGHLPHLSHIHTRPGGQVVAQVFPRTIYDRLLLNGISAEVWMQPEVTEETIYSEMASLYREPDPEGVVVLVLGAGNVNSIPPLDVLYHMIVRGHVVMLKMNPVNDYLEPLIAAVFAPFIRFGFLRVISGGAEVGEYLTHHPDVDEIHLTGSARTHDAIFFGSGPEGAARRARNESLINKPVTSELGGVGPLIILPGRWSAADIRYQAEHAVTMKMHNGGFNCVACQVMVLPESWDQRAEFMAAVRQVLRELPARHAFYPGAAQRQRDVVATHAHAETYGDAEVPLTLIPDLDPNGDDYCFTTEFFGTMLAQTSLPGDDAASFLRNAVDFCNERLTGTLGATIIAHPRTLRELGPAFEQALADLRYGTIGVNLWAAAAFLMPEATWGAYPGHTEDNIGSGIGIVRNSLMFDRPQKTVARSSFYPFPRGWLHGDFNISPKPPWFVTNRTADRTARLVTGVAIRPQLTRLPRIFALALRG